MNYFKELDGSITTEETHNLDRDYMRKPEAIADSKCERVLNLLNEVLATEIVCVLRFKKQQSAAKDVHAELMAVEFQKLAQDSQVHVNLIAKRITQLRGEPNFKPLGRLMKSYCDYSELGSLQELIKEGWVAERVAIDSYNEIIRSINGTDPMTHKILENTLASEKAHADTLINLITSLDQRNIVGSVQQSEPKMNEDGRLFSLIASSGNGT